MKETVNALNTYLQPNKPVAAPFNNGILTPQHVVMYTYLLGAELISDVPKIMCKVVYIFLRINRLEIMKTD
jgi:hypothetical protein